MIHLHSHIFNPFQENTYVLLDDQGHCILIDPGCYDDHEWSRLVSFLREKKASPQRLILTHCHLDHIFGVHRVEREFGLAPEYHPEEQPINSAAELAAKLYGVDFTPGKAAPIPLTPDDTVAFDGTALKVLFTPGHSPGSISLYNERDGWVIAGDALFFNSIGRTDLPGGDHETLIKAIHEQLLTLPDDTIVHCGHGPSTTIGHERRTNPFLVD